MEENLRESFIVDTSAFIGLESINLLEKVTALFDIVTIQSVIAELEDFAEHSDLYGKVARRILEFKERFKVMHAEEAEPIESTDNELYNLALASHLPLITDDVKLSNRIKEKVTVFFSTFFLIVFVVSELLSKEESLGKLETLRNTRNWQSNLIYQTTKAELEKINE